MRVAVAVLADAANVRENLVNVLSAGINQLNRPEYPNPMLTTLVLQVEVELGELPEDGMVPVSVTVSDAEQVVILASIEGAIDAAEAVLAKPDASFYLPVVMDLTPIQIPEPGAYVVRATVGALDPVDIKFWANPA